VGFLNYWELKQVPNFLLASPMVILSVCGIFSYLKNFNHKRNATNQHHHSTKQKATTDIYRNLSSRVLPFIIFWGLLVGIGVFFMHVQVITRFLSGCPPVYWYAASLFHSDDDGRARGGTTSTTNRGINSKQRLLLWYFFGYSFLGCILFCNFYPWT